MNLSDVWTTTFPLFQRTAFRIGWWWVMDNPFGGAGSSINNQIPA